MNRPLLSVSWLAAFTAIAAAQSAPGSPAMPAAPPVSPPPLPPPLSLALPPEAPIEVEVANATPGHADKAETAGYDHGFYVRSADDKFSLKIGGRLQAFYTLQRTAGTDDKSAFAVRDARLILEGNLYGPGLTYKFQPDFGQGFVTLKDFHVDTALTNDVWLRAGQWKRPFSRQQITSSGRLDLADRAITNTAFGAGRDLGIALRDNYEKSPISSGRSGCSTAPGPRRTSPAP